MLAILAAICFVLIVFGVASPVNLLALGLVFLALQLVIPRQPWPRQ